MSTSYAIGIEQNGQILFLHQYAETLTGMSGEIENHYGFEAQDECAPLSFSDIEDARQEWQNMVENKLNLLAVPNGTDEITLSDDEDNFIINKQALDSLTSKLNIYEIVVTKKTRLDLECS